MDDFNPRSYTDRESAWLAFRKLWLKDNPPCDNGYYMCGIGGEWVRADEVTLDHIDGRDGTLMFDKNNIQPSCGWHNYRKGSKRWKPKVSKEVYKYLRTLNEI